VKNFNYLVIYLKIKIKVKFLSSKNMIREDECTDKNDFKN